MRLSFHLSVHRWGGTHIPYCFATFPRMPWGSRGGVPCQVQLGGGYPARVVPWPGGYPGREGTLAGGVTLARGYPGWGGTQLGQHREYLLHGGRYASCVHTGGLSYFKLYLICFIVKFYGCTNSLAM